jgi:hypothetical protein
MDRGEDGALSPQEEVLCRKETQAPVPGHGLRDHRLSCCAVETYITSTDVVDPSEKLRGFFMEICLSLLFDIPRINPV